MKKFNPTIKKLGSWTGASATLFLPFVVFALPTTCSGFVSFFTKIGNNLAAIIGGVAIVMFLIAAFYFVVGGGSEDAQSKAKNLLIYGVIGVVVALFALVLPKIIVNVIGGTAAGCK